MTNKDRADELRKRAADITVAAGYADDPNAHRADMDEARQLFAQADKLDPRPAKKDHPKTIWGDDVMIDTQDVTAAVRSRLERRKR